jgi:acetolactate synthase regulatory subunit
MEAGTPQVVKLEDLRVPGQLSGRKHVLSILVENKPGVLARVAGLFSRRGFNIDTLAVGPTDDPSISRVTLTLDGAVHPIDQVTKQLHKLINVLKIRDMEPEETVAREMALFKVSSAVENRAERGHRLGRQDRGLRAHGPAPRAGRDGPDGRDRDRPRRRLKMTAPDAGMRRPQSPE